MKKMILSLLAMLCLGLGIHAQTQQVSAKVLKQFKTLFADAKDVDWLQEDNECIGYFIMDSYFVQVIFSKDAEWKSTIKYMNEDELVPKMKELITEQVNEPFQYQEIMEIESPEISQLQITTKTNDGFVKLFFDKNHQFISKDKFHVK